ncbi:MAG: hypothetical protein HN396_04630 [Gemmatimonadales bacterium]|jgi:hypothetical protein|nr:hypothetical protein [Gemmatimonadales bacterium]
MGKNECSGKGPEYPVRWEQLAWDTVGCAVMWCGNAAGNQDTAELQAFWEGVRDRLEGLQDEIKAMETG